MTRQEYAQLMKQFREHLKFTQEEAAARLGVSVRTLQNWEIARNMPRGFGLHAILKTLGVPATDRKITRAVAKQSNSPAPVSSFMLTLETHLL